jgi:carbon storage regulator
VIVEIRGDKVRLGIEYPKGVAVHRNEVYEAIRRNAAGAEMEKSASPNDAVRQRIAELRRQIRELEAQLAV